MKKINILLSILLIGLILPLLMTSGKANIPLKFMCPIYNYDNSIISEKPTANNSYRSIYSFIQRESGANIQITFDEPLIYSMYIIRQTYCDFERGGGSYSDYMDAIQFIHEIKVRHAGNNKYLGNIRVIPYNDRITFKVSNFLWDGDSYEFSSTYDFCVYNFNSFGLNYSTVKNMEYHIQYRLAYDGSTDILFQIKFYINGKLESLYSGNLFTIQGAQCGGLYSNWQQISTNEAGKNCVVGTRYLFYNEEYPTYMSLFLDIPDFYEKINIVEDYIVKAPKTYWTYMAFKLEESEVIELEIRDNITFLDTYIDLDFSYDFTTIKGVDYTARYYYTLTVLKNGDFGNWDLFNWLRNGLVAIINALLFICQFLSFLLVMGLNWLLGALFMVIIIPFLYNIILFYLLLVLIWVLFWIVVGIILLVNVLVEFFLWLSTDVLYPFFIYLVEDVFPIVVQWIIVLIAWIIAIFLYILCIGQVDIIELELIIESFLEAIAEFMFLSTAFMITYLPELLMYLVFYLVLVGFCFLKLTYVKARGFVNRGNQLQSSLEAYVVPIQLGYNVVLKIKNIIVGWL